jgi:UDP-2,3-diacylglucosamine hydrolase
LAQAGSSPHATPWVAPPSWKVIDFISDLHLSEDTPRTFDAWSEYLRSTPADCIVILGDLFETWVGDDALQAGFEAAAAAVLKEATERRHLAFMVGNRDFLVGPAFHSTCNTTPLPDPTLLLAQGQALVLSHGDALCIGDHAYQQFRATVRAQAWQREFLAQPLADRRALAASLRAQSRAAQQKRRPEEWFDVDDASALTLLNNNAAMTLIHGHTHRPATHLLAPGQMRHVLSDWDLDHASPTRSEVLRLQEGRLRRVLPGSTAL